MLAEFMDQILQNFRDLFIPPPKDHPVILTAVITAVLISIMYTDVRFCMTPDGNVCPESLMQRWGGFQPQKFYRGSGYPGINIFSYALHHYNGWHIFGNLLSIIPASAFLEHHFGFIRITVFHFLCILSGGIMAWLVNKDVMYLGYSAVCYGCLMAVCLTLLLDYERFRRPLIPYLILVSFIATFVIDCLQVFGPVAVYPHLGGVLTSLMTPVIFALPISGWRRYLLLAPVLVVLYYIIAPTVLWCTRHEQK